MKYLINAISLVSIWLMLNACCMCTEVACPGPVLEIKLIPDLNDYEQGQMVELLVIQTNQHYEHLYILITPFRAGKSHAAITISSHFIEGKKEFKSYNFVIENPALQRKDTIHHINYEKTNIEKKLCNDCDPETMCADEFFTDFDYKNVSLRYNDRHIDSLTINY